MTERSYNMSMFNWGDFIIQIIFFTPFPLLIIGIIFAFRVMKRAEVRAEERLKIAKDHANFQQKQMHTLNDLNKRLTKIETILKSVD